MAKLTNEYLRSLSVAEFQELIRKTIRKYFGDKIENKTGIWSSHGYWYIYLPLNGKTKQLGRDWNGMAFRRYSLKALINQIENQ